MTQVVIFLSPSLIGYKLSIDFQGPFSDYLRKILDHENIDGAVGDRHGGSR